MITKLTKMKGKAIIDGKLLDKEIELRLPFPSKISYLPSIVRTLCEQLECEDFQFKEIEEDNIDNVIIPERWAEAARVLGDIEPAAEEEEEEEEEEK